MKILAVAFKDLRLVIRDRWAFAFLFVVPIVVIMVVAGTRSGDGTRNIVFPVVNDDQGPVANALITVFGEHLHVLEVDRATARQLVAVRNKAPAAIILPA